MTKTAFVMFTEIRHQYIVRYMRTHLSVAYAGLRLVEWCIRSFMLVDDQDLIVSNPSAWQLDPGTSSSDVWASRANRQIGKANRQTANRGDGRQAGRYYVILRRNELEVRTRPVVYIYRAVFHIIVDPSLVENSVFEA